MKVGFVVEPYEESHASGMGYSVMATMLNLPKAAPGYKYVFYSSRPINPALLPAGTRNVLMPKGFVRQFFWFLRLSKKEVDVLIFVAPLLPLLVPRGIRTLVLCKDLANLTMSAQTLGERVKLYLRDRFLMPLVLRHASAIAASSEATEHDLMHFYRVPREKIAITYEGYQDFTGAELEPAPESYKPYFFFTGKVKPRKNVHGIVDAFISLKRRTGLPCKLVIAGDYGGEYYRAMDAKLAEAGYRNEVYFVGYVSKAQLHGLYKGAVSVVFPSINEGFGMPIIEAMSLGVPVITSNISSMAEVVAGAGLTVDPYDPEDISAAMEKMYTDASLREELEAKGLRRARDFSWSKVAERYAELLQKIA